MKNEKRAFIKLTTVFLAVIMCCTLLVFAVACDFTGSKPAEDNRSNVAKPTIAKVLQDYDAQTAKCAELSANVEMKLFKKDGTIGLKQVADFSRKSDGQHFYANGTIKTESIDIGLINCYKLIRLGFDNEYDYDNDGILEYLNGQSTVSLKIGVDNTTQVYNVLAQNIKKGQAYGSLYLACEDEVIKEVLNNAEFKLFDLLMSSGVLDLKNASEWLDQDTESKYFSTEKDKFLYGLDVNTQKVQAMLVKKLEEVSSIFDVKLSKEDRDIIQETMSKWIKVSNPTNVKANVSENGLLDQTDTSFNIDININLTDLDKVLFKVFGKEKKDEISKKVSQTVTLFNLQGTNGEDNTIGIRITMNCSEKYLYGENNCKFDASEQRMFVGLDEEITGRKIITAEDIQGILSGVAEKLGLINKENNQGDNE